VPVSTVTATPSAGEETVTIVQNANGASVGNMTGGDKALWLQDTIDQRQSWTKAKITEIHTALDKAAVALGYADTAAAQAAQDDGQGHLPLQFDDGLRLAQRERNRHPEPEAGRQVRPSDSSPRARL
jgi:hypothetical protein